MPRRHLAVIWSRPDQPNKLPQFSMGHNRNLHPNHNKNSPSAVFAIC